MTSEMSFEQSLNRLEEIVRDLERQDLALEQALRLFEEGIGHLRSAGSALKAVDAQVQQLVEAADGSFSVEDFGD
ncbi:MAG TPA: exodeoxyribonuclease VII small subunit [Gemmatimonas sp.]|uniref:exodeoxyribonuclease VII small subunit n=1 Tax=Gemmatimonas sp. TaxID=1962908 RepID=UPI002EDA4BC5